MKSPPITQETITGSASVCQEQTGVSFSIPSIPSATGYGWTLPPGATITSGFNTNNILVDFSSVASSGLVTVAGTNECGSGIPSAGFHVTVNAPVPSLLELPTTVVLSGESPVYKARQTITAGGNGLTFTIQQGGNVQMVAGYNTRLLSGVFVHSGGNLLAKITNVPDPCVIQQQPLVARTNGSDESTASPEKELGMFKIYPNPNNGKFILELNPESGPSEVSVSIYGIMGETIMQRELNATKYHEFSLEDKPTGIYIIRVIQGERTETRKTIKN